MLKDYYEILSVPQDASLAEIKQRYQKLLLIVMTRFLSIRSTTLLLSRRFLTFFLPGCASQ